MMNNSSANAAGKRVVMGSLLFKVIGYVIIFTFISLLAAGLTRLPASGSELVISFHVFYNLVRCLAMLPFVDAMSRFCLRLIPEEAENTGQLTPRYLDHSALDTPSLALVNAARETLRIGDVIEQMIATLTRVIHGEAKEAKLIPRLDDQVDILYNGIKLYLAQISKEDMPEEESRRWAEIFDMAVNLEQAGDVPEKMGIDIAAKSLAAHRPFSDQGLEELQTLQLLLDNLPLSLSVFISCDETAARRLSRAKHRFRILNQRHSMAHVDRLHLQNIRSLETSALYLGLLGEMKRLNSLFCSAAYSVLGIGEKDAE